MGKKTPTRKAVPKKAAKKPAAKPKMVAAKKKPVTAKPAPSVAKIGSGWPAFRYPLS
jgi:hypothetical protein